jgi:hypothetical protein
MILRWMVSFCIEWFWGKRFLFVFYDFEVRGLFCVDWFSQKRPLTSKSYHSKRNLSPKINQHKKKPLTSNSFNIKKNSHLNIMFLFVLNDFEVRGFFLFWMILRWEVSSLYWMILRWEVSFSVDWFSHTIQNEPSHPKSINTKRNLSPQIHST